MFNVQSYTYVYLVAFGVNILLGSSVGFNIDNTIGIYKRCFGDNSSMFGYSVALHIENKQSWVISGAPKFRKRGGVFRCMANMEHMERKLLSLNFTTDVFNETMYNISNAWLGARVESLGEDRPIVVCAPRFLYHHQTNNSTSTIPTGYCFVKPKLSNSTVEHINPCERKNKSWQIDDSTCQAGFSTAFSIQEGKEYLYVGSPSHQGKPYSNYIHAFRMTDYGEENDKQKQKKIELDNMETTNFPYALASIKFGTEGVLAASMPRGSEYNGTVFIFNATGRVAYKIVGETLGTYFGYALCVLDINGDTKDDLVVSAPLFTKDSMGEVETYDVGRVYIYIQNKISGTFSNPITIDGFKERGRFGMALTSLADIDRDGYMDFAVGAPYDGPENRGAVYIYRGNANGPSIAYSQVIYANNLMNPPTTFGFSLSGGVDTDGNMYPDLAVGAYESDIVYLFKSRPVVIVSGSIEFSAKNKAVSREIKECMVKGMKVTCTNIRSCFSFTGLAVPNKIALSISWTLDITAVRSGRIFFLGSNDSTTKQLTMNLKKDITRCVNGSVYFDPDLKDLLTPFVAEVVYSLDASSEMLKPVVDPLAEMVKRDQIRLRDNCGNDGICTPDLKLNITTNDSHTLGSPDPMIIEISISNVAEDAYEASFFMTFPDKLYFKKIEHIQSASITPMCSILSQAHSETIHCNIGNPFTSNKVIKFKILLNPSNNYDEIPSYTLHFKVNSTNVEDTSTLHDNTVLKTINIAVDTRISITGTTLGGNVFYNMTNYKPLKLVKNETDIGPEVIHEFVIRHEGVTPIYQVNVFIQWPSNTLSGDIVLKLTGKKEKQISCKDSHSELFVFGEPIDMGPRYDTVDHDHLTSTDLHLTSLLNCQNFQCDVLSCVIYNLSNSDVSSITLRGRLAAYTIDSLAPDVPVQLSSRIFAVIANRPYFNKSTDLGNVYMHEELYIVIPEKEHFNTVPLWVVVASSPFGTIILLLTIYTLYKLGFFKRHNKPESDEEMLTP